MKWQLLGISGVILRLLYQRSKQLTAAAVMINEYNTSKVCLSRKTRNLEHAKLANGTEFFEKTVRSFGTETLTPART
ncbi:uncharacterized protein B0P05DRAFT_584740 [Gilbertella persicaria]|uniref:uncharacterized protein n=1 Tax=Gilbertella persicaria TaxID=101096 RepID=UPI00221F6CAA|nr:uncharacterized protein B0P05DRAFT_584740 [Gilbertella persicaria]KAI8088030.1 hypothetical protein B0P05DRAFT_584740 [Gilbertella persicaria]